MGGGEREKSWGTGRPVRRSGREVELEAVEMRAGNRMDKCLEVASPECA